MENKKKLTSDEINAIKTANKSKLKTAVTNEIIKK